MMRSGQCAVINSSGFRPLTSETICSTSRVEPGGEVDSSTQSPPGRMTLPTSRAADSTKRMSDTRFFSGVSRLGRLTAMMNTSAGSGVVVKCRRPVAIASVSASCRPGSTMLILPWLNIFNGFRLDIEAADLIARERERDGGGQADVAAAHDLNFSS